MNSLSLKDKIEILLKILAVTIAAFAIWKYFDEQRVAKENAAASRAIAYIDRFGSIKLVQAREELQAFWHKYPQIGEALRESRLTRNAYEMFVFRVFPDYSKKEEMSSSLFSMRVFFDEIAFCRASGNCSEKIIDDYFCSYVTKYVGTYRPFYEFLSRDFGSESNANAVLALSMSCKRL